MGERREIPIAAPCTGEEECEAVRGPILDGWLAQGPRVAAFERAFAQRHGARRAVATTSGTTALHLALSALGVGAGDDVLVPAFTWVATANAVRHAGGRPVFVDVDPATYNIDPARVAEAVSGATRAVIPVHLFGLCADLDAVAEAAPGVPLVEDAACAAGASYRGRPAGSLGAAAAFSFHPRKSITTGEGGMVTSGDEDLAERARSLRNHGGPGYERLGFNYRMTDVQAALGLAQLEKLDRFVEERERGAATYRRELADVPWLRLPSPAPPGGRHAWQSFVCVLEEGAPLSRDRCIEALAARGVQSRPGTQAVHELPLYGEDPDRFPNARDLGRRSLAIPLHNRMSDEDYAYVVEAIRALG